MTWDGGGASTSFGGTDITYDLPSLTITGGTVNGMVETRDGAVTYAVHGVAMSAQALLEAARTSSTADDAALIRAALSGADAFVLSSENDRARGHNGNDVLNGRGGDDVLAGGAGAHVLIGGRGTDVLTGGTGADDFVLDAAKESGLGVHQRDVIKDFAKGQDDIGLTSIDANGTVDGNQAFTLDAGGTFGAGEIRQAQKGASPLIELNTDGDAAAEASILLNNVTGPLAASDFLL